MRSEGKTYIALRGKDKCPFSPAALRVCFPVNATQCFLSHSSDLLATPWTYTHLALAAIDIAVDSKRPSLIIINQPVIYLPIPPPSRQVLLWAFQSTLMINDLHIAR